MDLIKDLINLNHLLASQTIKLVIGKIVQLWKRHNKILEPIFGRGLEVARRIVSDSKCRAQIQDKLRDCIESIKNGLKIGVAYAFVFIIGQFQTLKDAISALEDPVIGQQFKTIEQNIVQLQVIASEIEKLIELFKLTNDIDEEDHLIEAIDDKLAEADQLKYTSGLIGKQFELLKDKSDNLCNFTLHRKTERNVWQSQGELK